MRRIQVPLSSVGFVRQQGGVTWVEQVRALPNSVDHLWTWCGTELRLMETICPQRVGLHLFFTMSLNNTKLQDEHPDDWGDISDAELLNLQSEHLGELAYI